MRVSVLIPTLNAAGHLPTLLDALREQTRLPDEIVVVDSSSTDGTADLARSAGCVVISIERTSFDHGRTRNLAAGAATGDALLYLTQDAVPVDEHYVSKLVAPLEAGEAAGAYARQVARDGSPPTDAYLRAYNYPRLDGRVVLRTAADVARLGVRAYMMSNAASAVRRDRFEAAGRFPSKVIMNEDMLLCARLLRAGDAVAYVPSAAVWHSHAYSLAQHQARYFDIGVFMARHRDELGTRATTGGGLRFVAGQIAWLARRGHLTAIPRALAEAAAKWRGYRLGLRHASLTTERCRQLSMHRAYWD